MNEEANRIKNPKLILSEGAASGRERETLLKGKIDIAGVKESEEDAVLNISLRPSKFSEFVGHKDIVDNLKISIQAAKQRK
ncbi:MAG TPA: hypothetical protein PLJ15_01860, partial [Candidatus Omnitrophota bacterium]|nr:hypothetical protein [Candidatus Omnitrophota bacterium]